MAFSSQNEGSYLNPVLQLFVPQNRNKVITKAEFVLLFFFFEWVSYWSRFCANRSQQVIDRVLSLFFFIFMHCFSAKYIFDVTEKHFVKPWNKALLRILYDYYIIQYAEKSHWTVTFFSYVHCVHFYRVWCAKNYCETISCTNASSSSVCVEKKKWCIFVKQFDDLPLVWIKYHLGSVWLHLQSLHFCILVPRESYIKSIAPPPLEQVCSFIFARIFFAGQWWNWSFHSVVPSFCQEC